MVRRTYKRSYKRSRSYSKKRPTYKKRSYAKSEPLAMKILRSAVQNKKSENVKVNIRDILDEIKAIKMNLK